DKYAQYMTGFMYLMGQGLPEDPVRASAWYRLSAERQAPEFMVVRDELIRTFNAEQLAASDAIYLELRKKFSDIVIVMRLLEEDLELLDVEATGSRVPSGSNLVTTLDPRKGTVTSVELYRDRVRRTLQSRVDFITGQLDIERMDADLSAAQIAELWERIEEQVSVIDDDVHRLVAAP
ncbi:MAG: SEL1-like repeat protein, partial [Woeseiaceae bacterium]